LIVVLSLPKTSLSSKVDTDEDLKSMSRALEDEVRPIEAKYPTEPLRVLEAHPDVRVVFTEAEMPPGPTGDE
jgi:hypothetical protein